MKIEYKLIPSPISSISHSSVPYDLENFGIYISKNELIKNFEQDLDLFIAELTNLTEMLTSPHCFKTNFWYKDSDYRKGFDYKKIEEIIESMKKSTNKGILLYVIDDDYTRSFNIGIIKT